MKTKGGNDLFGQGPKSLALLVELRLELVVLAVVGSINIPDCPGLNSSILEQSENNAWPGQAGKSNKNYLF